MRKRDPIQGSGLVRSLVRNRGNHGVQMDRRLRDQHLFGTKAKIKEIYQRRYIPGQKIYLETEQPFEKANVVLDNNDFQNPVLKIGKPAQSKSLRK